MLCHEIYESIFTTTEFEFETRPSASVGLKGLNKTPLEDGFFWVVAPCSLVEVYQRAMSPDDGDSKDL
jgi:hypothetical protein